MSECVHKVLPVFNRCVVFTTSDDSWHGHPDPLACPQGMTRKSIATYYYTSFTQPEELSEFRRTNFRARSQSGDGAAAALRHGAPPQSRSAGGPAADLRGPRQTPASQEVVLAATRLTQRWGVVRSRELQPASRET